MQKFHYHFPETNKELGLVSDSIRKIFDTTLENIIPLTEAVETDIVVRNSPSNCIPELGISGRYTKDARCIDIYLDLDNQYLKENFESEISRTLIHEYMHVVREQYITWENNTFLEALIAEGLTQSFEVEVQPNLPPSIYATALTPVELAIAWTKAKDILDQRELNDDWFFGGNEIKKWTGYSLGYKLVQDKIKQSGLKASELYKLPSKEFLNTN